MQEQENTTLQCIHQLESAELTRATLISQLKEALNDQVKFGCLSNPLDTVSLVTLPMHVIAQGPT